MFSRRFLNFAENKKPSGQERTAAERSYAAKATRRRRRILLYRVLYREPDSRRRFLVSHSMGVKVPSSLGVNT